MESRTKLPSLSLAVFSLSGATLQSPEPVAAAQNGNRPACENGRNEQKKIAGPRREPPSPLHAVGAAAGLPPPFSDQIWEGAREGSRRRRCPARAVIASAGLPLPPSAKSGKEGEGSRRRRPARAVAAPRRRRAAGLPPPSSGQI
uniref:Uncharacterized protein n=1 Tax=Oryza sativa subsp. japonica TaxID=39947 RepID=Q8SB90_ORYSJ|nr:hypothetical protein [Oryza sativa Japonica Group]